MKLSVLWKNKDVLGWIIWIAVTAALIGPCIYLLHVITYDTVNTMTRVIAGIFMAAILSGFITWIGNEIWFRISRKRAEQRKKTARKSKRNRGK